MILDKDTNKHVLVTTGETNNRSPPSFSATGKHRDPLLFLEEFDKAARWNNWRTDERKKEVFLLCLTGQAERWVKSFLMEDITMFNTLTFEDTTAVVNEERITTQGLLSLFKKKYMYY